MNTLTIGEFLQAIEVLHRMPPDRVLTICALPARPAQEGAIWVDTVGTTVYRNGQLHLSSTLVFNTNHSEVLIDP